MKQCTYALNYVIARSYVNLIIQVLILSLYLHYMFEGLL
jgi:hypothetical protein